MPKSKPLSVTPKKPIQPEWHDASENAYVISLKEAFETKILSAKEYAGETTLWINKDALLDICLKLKDDGFTYLVDIAGVHYPMNEKCYTIVYYLHHIPSSNRIRLKVEASENDKIPSVTSIWKTANWMEREAYDMLGIQFTGHPDLRRLLMWEGFHGHPLRKDFPLLGIDTGAAIYLEEYPEGGGPVKK